MENRADLCPRSSTELGPSRRMSCSRHRAVKLPSRLPSCTSISLYNLIHCSPWMVSREGWDPARQAAKEPLAQKCSTWDQPGGSSTCCRAATVTGHRPQTHSPTPRPQGPLKPAAGCTKQAVPTGARAMRLGSDASRRRASARLGREGQRATLLLEPSHPAQARPGGPRLREVIAWPPGSDTKETGKVAPAPLSHTQGKRAEW